MWKCPVCGKEIHTGFICSVCSFDETKNYIQYRPLARLRPEVCREYQTTFVQEEGTLEKGIERFKKRDYIAARGFFQKEAQKGDACSQYWMGCCLLESPKRADKEAGVIWLKKSAFQNFTPAQVNLGYYYYKKMPMETEGAQASDWFWKAANEGDGVGALWLGICYYLGRGCKQNYGTAFRWFQKAEKMWKDTDEWAVYFWLGVCCYYGHGAKINREQALEYFTKGRVYPGYLEEYMYRNGEVAFFNLVAYYLGRCFYEGTGVKKNEYKAFFHFRKAADDFKIPDAWYWLGLCYLNGTGTEKNIATAESCFKIAAEGKSEYNTVRYAKRWRKESYFYIEEELPREYRHEAECGLADCLWQKGQKEEAERLYKKAAIGGSKEAKNRLHTFFGGADESKEAASDSKGRQEKKSEQSKNEGVDQYLSDAEAGDASAQCNLGYCYANGKGVPQDYEKARFWYEKAAAQGYEKAQYNLGVAYEDGTGVPRDEEKAASWYEKAAAQGYEYAQFKLGFFYENGTGVPKDYEKAASWYEKAAAQGHRYAQYNLGVSYYYGTGVVQNYEEAVKWFEKAAIQDCVEAQYNLGVCCHYGRGVPQDYKKAVSWYEKAVEQNYAAAQNNLGVCYNNGFGVLKDNKKAADWYQKAAEQGHRLAQYNLGCCYTKGEGVPKDDVKAAEWYEKSADQGYAPAQHSLGDCYERGLGVSKDKNKAIEWYEKAAAQDYEQAKKALEQIKKRIFW